MMIRVIIIAITIVLFGCSEKDKKAMVTGMENKEIPKFGILLPDSLTYFNTSELKQDKNVILFYYKPSCPYCRAQMRDLLNNIDQFKNEQLCVLTGGDFGSMKEFVNYFKLKDYPDIITGLDTGFTVIRNYNLPGVPFTAVFDKTHRLQAAYLGKISHQNLLKVAGVKRY